MCWEGEEGGEGTQEILTARLFLNKNVKVLQGTCRDTLPERKTNKTENGYWYWAGQVSGRV